jgi:hypothetical protein
MPFTLAHPAAVMPLRRLRSLPTLALIVGSLVPDLPYYMPGRFQTTALHETHTLPGSVVLCVPLGLALLVIGLALRRPLTALMTERARWVSLRAAESFAARRVNWLLAIPAIVIGAWTHILWDACTHPGTWLVRRVEALSAPVNLFGMYTGEVSHVLQYVSSIVGLAVIACWYAQVAAQAPPEVSSAANRSSARRLLLSVVVAAAIGMGTFQALRSFHETPTVYRLIYMLLTRTLAWFTLLYAVAGTLVAFAQRPQPQLES